MTADATTKQQQDETDTKQGKGKNEEHEKKEMSVLETLVANVNMLDTFALATAERREAGAARITGQVWGKKKEEVATHEEGE